MRIFSSSAARAQALAAVLAPMADDLPDDLCAVLGGDGTMLRAIDRHGPDVRYLGVNCGRLGFLMNDVDGSPEEVAARIVGAIRSGGVSTHAFPRLSMEAYDTDGVRHDGHALNDVYVERMLGQTCHLRVVVDGVEVVRHMVCDGLIVATALGSTAYTFSAGGPAAHPRLRAMALTAICPHTPRLHPLVLPLESVVEVEVADPARRPARAVADGQPVPHVRRVVIRGDTSEVGLCFLAGHDFTATMIRKVLRGA